MQHMKLQYALFPDFSEKHFVIEIGIVQFSFVYPGFLYSFRVSRVICSAHFRLLAPWTTRLLSQ